MIDRFLERLERVRKSGKGYRACCPVHDDKDPSMSITEDGGKVLCFCFSCGATGEAVADALGLPMSALFSEPFIKQSLSREDRENLEMDRIVLIIAKSNPPKSYADFKRLRLAEERIGHLEALENSLHNSVKLE